MAVPPTTETIAASGNAPETPVFVSDRSVRPLLVRGAIAVVAVLFIAWVIALATGVSGFGDLPVLKDREGGGSAPADTAEKPPAASTQRATASQGSTGPNGEPTPAAPGKPTDRPDATGGTGGQTLLPTAPGTGTTHGQPDVTPGGNVPGANANGGNGNAYGGGTGGGKTKSG